MRDTSSVTVLPLSPRRSDGPSQPDYDPSCCLRPRIASSTSRVKFRGHIRVRLHYGPVTRCHPEDGLVDGLQRLGFPPPCHPSYKALALTLAGLTPAERVRLRWTHNATFRSQPQFLVLPFDDLEPRLTRQGYSVKVLAEQFHAKPSEIRRFLGGQLDAGRTRELADRMRAVGLAL